MRSFPKGTVPELHLRVPTTGGDSFARTEIRALTGVRGLAAVTVAIAHYQFSRWLPAFAPWERFFIWHNSAVDLFFMLSAFVLAYIYVGPGVSKVRFRAYFIARVARIYPLYLVTFLMVAGLSILAAARRGEFAHNLTLGDTARQLLMINSWPGVGTNIHWNFPAWSVSVEFLCYVTAFPLLARFATGPMLRLAFHWRALLLALVLAVEVLFNTRVPTVPLDPATMESFRGMLGFCVGYLSFLLCVDAPARVCSLTSLADAASVGFLVVLTLAAIGRVQYAHVLWFVPLWLIGFYQSDRSLSSRILSAPPIHYLGMISYSIYLWHFPIAKFLFGLKPALQDPVSVHGWLIVPLLMGSLSVVSCLSYHWLEAPARRRIRRLLSQSRPVHPAR